VITIKQASEKTGVGVNYIALLISRAGLQHKNPEKIRGKMYDEREILNLINNRRKKSNNVVVAGKKVCRTALTQAVLKYGFNNGVNYEQYF
jgi:hypothetical protein